MALLSRFCITLITASVSPEMTNGLDSIASIKVIRLLCAQGVTLSTCCRSSGVMFSGRRVSCNRPASRRMTSSRSLT